MNRVTRKEASTCRNSLQHRGTSLIKNVPLLGTSLTYMVTTAPPYRVTSRIRNRPPSGPYSELCLGPYGRHMGGGLFPMREVPL